MGPAERFVRVVIVGGGGIGVELAKILARHEQNEVVIIEIDEKRCQELSGELDALVLHGDGTHPELLAKADVKNADGLVAVTNSDAMNTVIAMLGHRNQTPTIIAKVEQVGLQAACREMGVSHVIAPNIASAARIAATLRGLHRLDFSLIARGGIQLVELPAIATAGKRIEELTLPESILVVAIVRDQDILLARGKRKVEEGDLLLVLVENESALEKARATLGSGP